MLPAKA